MTELREPRRLAVVIPFSREVLVDEGVVEPTVNERVLRRLQRLRHERKAAEVAARRNAWLANARFVTGPIGAALLDLHQPSDDGLWCSACGCSDCGDCGPEPWPCASVLVLAKTAHLEPPPGA